MSIRSWFLERRITQAMRLLAVFEAEADTWHGGLELSAKAGQRPGLLYPALSYLEAANYIEARWETDEERGPRRRPHHLYRLVQP